MKYRTENARRVAEDREREEYVRAMMDQLDERDIRPGARRFVRAAINSAWINGRNQILCREVT